MPLPVLCNFQFWHLAPAQREHATGRTPAGRENHGGSGVMNGVTALSIRNYSERSERDAPRPLRWVPRRAGLSVQDLSGRHCHVNRKFADQMTMAVTVHAATVAWRHVIIVANPDVAYVPASALGPPTSSPPPPVPVRSPSIVAVSTNAPKASRLILGFDRELRIMP
jgi:hypothetical protein